MSERMTRFEALADADPVRPGELGAVEALSRREAMALLLYGPPETGPGSRAQERALMGGRFGRLAWLVMAIAGVLVLVGGAR